MSTIYSFLLANIYLYICILIVLVIIATILFIMASNQRNRKKIKDDYVEAERVEAELEKIEEAPKSSELEDILKKMQEDIDLKPEDVVKKFEEEQEEKAIISYQELVDNVKSGKIEVIDDETSDVNFVESLEIDLNEEPIVSTIEDEESSVTPEMVKEAIQYITDSSVKEEPKKFKNSKFISPIYGVMENNLDYPTVKKSETVLDIMNTKDYNELTEEIKKQEEFLNTLKAFRNNL